VDAARPPASLWFVSTPWPPITLAGNRCSNEVSDAAAFVAEACNAPVMPRVTRQTNPKAVHQHLDLRTKAPICPKATGLSHFSRDTEAG
jgi:hypothetical protein